MTKPMTPDQEKFMAFEGLVQWARDVVEQASRISNALERQRACFSSNTRSDPVERRACMHAFHSACHHFVIAAHKVMEYRTWVVACGFCLDVDFSELDEFPKDGIRDLRNMREHVVEYFQGRGHNPTRWFVQTPQYKADASSVVGTMIGGRLDWIKFAATAERLIPVLLAQSIPYPRDSRFP